MPIRLDAGAADFAARFAALVEARREETVDVRQAVTSIIDQVRAEGDQALLRLTEQFDGPGPGQVDLAVSSTEIAAARAACAAEDLAALELAAARIRAFHERQRPSDLAWTDALGTSLGLRWQPIEAVGLYVPGGKAAYPSSVLMNAIPAKVAGCSRLVMTVPTPHGQILPLVLVAAAIGGVDEIYRVGGAQAIAALAYGTERIRPVDKIVGPGNAYVAEAKRQVFGRVGIDMIAGPSEIVVLADADNEPDWLAADLLSQAEHDEVAQAILITDSPSLADAVTAAVERQLGDLPRQAIARASWERFGAVVIVPTLEAALPLIDRLAPEHLELAVVAPERLAPRVRCAGAIFLGRWTPEVIGDYVGGPNHVLPTGRTARFASGLSVYDFLTRTTLLGCDVAAFRALAPAAERLALAEGLGGHARAIAYRRGNAG